MKVSIQLPQWHLLNSQVKSFHLSPTTSFDMYLYNTLSTFLKIYYLSSFCNVFISSLLSTTYITFMPFLIWHSYIYYTVVVLKIFLISFLMFFTVSVILSFQTLSFYLLITSCQYSIVKCCQPFDLLLCKLFPFYYSIFINITTCHIVLISFYGHILAGIIIDCYNV